MKEFEHIGKQMPYAESEDYLDEMIANATEKAIGSQVNQQRPNYLRIASFAAIAVAASLLLVVGWTWLKPQPETFVTEQMESPVDEFLDGLTDEEVQLLAYYEIEDIPEY